MTPENFLHGLSRVSNTAEWKIKRGANKVEIMNLLSRYTAIFSKLNIPTGCSNAVKKTLARLRTIAIERIIDLTRLDLIQEVRNEC